MRAASSTRENARRRYARALLAVYAAASDDQRAYGASWYEDALEAATRLAAGRCTVAHAAGVIAALSPRNAWGDNLADASTLLDWFYADPDEPFEPLWAVRWRMSAFTACIEKAVDVLNSVDPLSVLRGPKERAFYANIMGDADAVTVDVWATRAATRGAMDEPRGHYADIAAAYRRAARRADTTPQDLQAAVWLVLRDTTAHGNIGGGGWTAARHSRALAA